MEYKMIALDLDGTLNNDEKVITPRTRDALMAVQEQGVIVALVSGRQAPGLQREADALHLEDYHGLRISYNGGRIQDATTGKILFDSAIDNATAVDFLRHLEQWPELSPIVDDGEFIYTTDASRHKVMDESRNNNLQVKIVDNIADAVDFEPVKILTAAPNEILVPHLADIRRMIYEGLPAVKVAMEVHITAMDIRMYAKEYGGNLLEQLNENEGCRTRKATPQELEAVKDIKGNTMCIYGTGWASKY